MTTEQTPPEARCEAEIAHDPKKIITIHLEGGVIHDIQNIPADTLVKVIDTDVFGLEPHEIENIDGQECRVSWYGRSEFECIADELAKDVCPE